MVESRLDEPIVLGEYEVARAIIGGENNCKHPNNPADTSVHWGASNYPSKLTFANLVRLRADYRIPDDLNLILPELDERAWYLRSVCVVMSETIFKAGFRLPILSPRS